MGLTLAARRQVTARLAGRYVKGTRAEKAAILDQLCVVNDWHRDHARKALRAALAGPPPPRASRAPVLVYGPEVITALRFVWATADGPTGKRLAPIMGLLVDSLRRHGELDISDEIADALCAMAPATIDRRLAPDRAQLSTKPHGSALTRPGSMLKSAIPMKTWAEWDDTVPGFVEIDLVGHDGGDNNGQFCFTLTVTDVATGWTSARTVSSKGERVVAAALDQIRVGLPFHLAGIHSDNGGEFINHHLLRWCQAREITFTRGRPARSNDNAHVEQKNWALARRSVGYYRYDTPTEEHLLNQLWAHQDVLFNLFNAQQKLVSKTPSSSPESRPHAYASCAGAPLRHRPKRRAGAGRRTCTGPCSRRSLAGPPHPTVGTHDGHHGGGSPQEVRGRRPDDRHPRVARVAGRADRQPGRHRDPGVGRRRSRDVLPSARREGDP